MSDDAVGHAAELLGALARADEPIGPRTTYRVGGNAALYVEIGDEATLRRVAEAVTTTNVAVLVLGKGSNLLVSTSGFGGLCVALTGDFEALVASRERDRVEAGGGLAYPVLARRLAAIGLGGMSWAVGIPGSVGGAVAMNAGGHGASTAERLIEARVIDLATNLERVVAPADLQLSYRHSNLLASELVLSAQFALEPAPPEQLESEIDEVVAWRREHQPGGRNAGSVFTNPAGDAAGRLLEEVGAKGLRVGSAQVSEKHANFIGADSGGSAEDVYELIQQLRRLVAEREGIELVTEVRLVGFAS